MIRNLFAALSLATVFLLMQSNHAIGTGTDTVENTKKTYLN